MVPTFCGEVQRRQKNGHEKMNWRQKQMKAMQRCLININMPLVMLIATLEVDLGVKSHKNKRFDCVQVLNSTFS